MEKLKLLRPSPWEAIEWQADALASRISVAQSEGVIEVQLTGRIHSVNKAILECNGFEVIEFDYTGSSPQFVVRWT